MHRDEIDLEWVRQQYRYETLTWPELDASAGMGKVVVMPVGSIEQHGHHLPVDVDVRLATSVCLAAGERAPAATLVLPPVTFGYCHHVMDFPGTITVRQTTFIEHLVDVGTSLAYHGFKRILMVNGHGSNHQLVERAARAVTLRTDALCANLSWWQLAADRWENEIRQSRPGGCGHACELETAMYLHVNGEGVRTDRIRGGIATYLTEIEDGREWQMVELTGRNGPATLVEWTSTFTETGVAGLPELATAENGELVFSHTVDRLCGLIEWFRSRPRPDRVDHHADAPTFEFPLDL
jgi:creatinine amidohydrolase